MVFFKLLLEEIVLVGKYMYDATPDRDFYRKILGFLPCGKNNKRGLGN